MWHYKSSSKIVFKSEIDGLSSIGAIIDDAMIEFWKSYARPRNEPDKVVNVVADLKWSAQWAPFEYNTQMSPLSVADDMAREPWSKEYFQLLKKLHQTHYEQMGCLSGTVSIDDQKYKLNMPAMRDHTFGPLRDWCNFHRYVYHFMFLENGDCMAVGSVSQPAVFSHITIGYLCRKADQSVHAVDFSDFHLYKHAENQMLPEDYGFIFKAGGQSYEVLVNVFDEDQFYIGEDREAKLYERWCNVKVNGVKGKACVEWHYNNTRKQKSLIVAETQETATSGETED